VGRATRFPARFQLIAAMNPCPCGMAGDADLRCACPPGVPERYASRISGPLRDRIDLWITMPKVPPASLVGGPEPESSAAVAARIAAARAIAMDRSGTLNGRLAGRALRAACRLSPAAARRAIELADLEALSGRGTERLMRVARTIADLRGRVAVLPDDLDEASRFRSPASRLRAREAS
jgi:magnesium chelatase family protein